MANYLKMGKIFLSIILFGILSIFFPTFLLRSGEIELSYKYIYVFILLIYFLMFLIIDRFIDIKKFALLLNLPLLILTIYGLKINFDHLYPSFFPAVNIIYLGGILPFLFGKNRILTFVPIFIILSVVSFFGYSHMELNYRLKSNKGIALNLNDINLKNYNDRSFTLDNKGSYVIDCMFTTCAPCIEKLSYLNGLGDINKVYVLIDGKIDNFQSYISFQNTNQRKYENLVFLYDSGGKFMKNHNVEKYPTEFVIKDGNIVGKEIGYSKYDLDDYIESRESILKGTNSINNEK